MPAKGWSKLNPQLTAEIVELVQRGHAPDTAAVSRGISVSSYYGWMRQGEMAREDEESPYGAFWRAITRACAEAEIKLVDDWLQGDEKGAGYGPARAKADYLQRTKSRYTEKVPHQLKDALEYFIRCAQRVLAPEDCARLLEAVTARDRSEAPGADEAGEEQEPVH